MSNKKFSEFERELFSKAQECSLIGDEDGVLKIMLKLKDSNSSNPIFRELLAASFWRLGRYEEASVEFECALKMDPSLEKSSVGLFHVRLALGDEEGAFEEMKRYLSVYDSVEYELLLEEMNGKQ